MPQSSRFTPDPVVIRSSRFIPDVEEEEVIVKPPIVEEEVVIEEEPIKETYWQGVRRRALQGFSEEELGGNKVIGPPGNEVSLLPEWKSQPETFAGGFTRSLYNDMLRPMATASGIIGSSQPGKIPSLRNPVTKGNVTYKPKATPGIKTPKKIVVNPEDYAKAKQVIKSYEGGLDKVLDKTDEEVIAYAEALDRGFTTREPRIIKVPKEEKIIKPEDVKFSTKAEADAAKPKKTEVDIITGKPKKSNISVDPVTGEEITGVKPKLKITQERKQALGKILEEAGIEDTIHPAHLANRIAKAKRAKASRIRTSDPEVGRRILTQEVETPLQEPIRQVLPPNKPPTIPPRKGPEYSPIEYMNIPKAFSASGDISFPFRQGISMIGRKEWWQSWKPMMKSLVSEDSYKQLQKEITSNPKFTEAVERGLSLTDFPGQTLPSGLSKSAIKKLGQQEEQFASRVAEKITGGKYSFIRASNRAYTAFANNLRLKTYENLTSRVDDLLVKGEIANPDSVKKNIADYINTASGRGSMGLRIGEKSQTLERAAELLNTTFWSPRFLASRMQLLNPLSYTKLDPFTRKEALKDLVKAVSAGGSILGLAQLGGAEIDLNPTSTDFAKAKFGNTRVDLTGGFSPIIRFIAQGIDGMANISDDDAKGPDVMRFIRSKLSPAAGAFVDVYSGKDYLGKEATIPSELVKIFTPMVAQDLIELYQEDPDLRSVIGGGAIASIGGNVQVYSK